MNKVISTPIYLYYTSTTPLDKRVLDAMLPYFLEDYGNAASATHLYGDHAKKAGHAMTALKEETASASFWSASQ